MPNENLFTPDPRYPGWSGRTRPMDRPRPVGHGQEWRTAGLIVGAVFIVGVLCSTLGAEILRLIT